MSSNERLSWIVRVTQTNQYNWIVLIVMGGMAVLLGVLGLTQGDQGGLALVIFGALLGGPGAAWLRRATSVPVGAPDPEAESTLD